MPSPVLTDRRHNVIDLSVRPSVRPSVRSFVMKIVKTMFWKRMNQICCKLAQVDDGANGWIRPLLVQ